MSAVVKEILSLDSSYKAVIYRREDGNYQVNILKWTHEMVPGYGEVCEPFWSDVTVGLSLTDTLEDAEKIATERLADYI